MEYKDVASITLNYNSNKDKLNSVCQIYTSIIVNEFLAKYINEDVEMIHDTHCRDTIYLMIELSFPTFKGRNMEQVYMNSCAIFKSVYDQEEFYITDRFKAYVDNIVKNYILKNEHAYYTNVCRYTHMCQIEQLLEEKLKNISYTDAKKMFK